MNEKISFWEKVFRPAKKAEQPAPSISRAISQKGDLKSLDIPPNDPFLPYLLASNGVIEVAKLRMDSPTVEMLREEGIQLTLPLVSQGELIGLLNLGSRMSEQEYSSDDFRLLNNLASHAGPALRIAQLARQQQAEALERERIEHELRVARVIQETLLPKEIPSLPGWRLDALWKPAWEVSGDFYDFISLADDRIGVLVADVTDKGVPAAMVMATTRSILRAAAERLKEPGQVLARTNDLLHPDIPQKMFVTCLYLILEPRTGRLVFANAGHNLPYLRTRQGVEELRATGMPLGLMPGMDYEEKEILIQPGETILLSSDGLVEAHNADRQMFGFPRLQTLVGAHPGGEGMIQFLMASFSKFTGQDYEQEDDITLVSLERSEIETPSSNSESPGQSEKDALLVSFRVPSEPGNERRASSRVVEILTGRGLPSDRLKKLETAVAEATMNAMEHGNHYQPDIPVEIKVIESTGKFKVHITDRGGGAPIKAGDDPDLDAKLAGDQSPRGWGLFLIKNMVDEMNIIQDTHQHTIELVMVFQEQDA